MDKPKRFALGLAYQHGRDPLIKAGLDGAVDFITEDELEKAAHAFLAKGQPVVNIFHTNGTEGHATVVESYLHRGADWHVADASGRDVVIKSGDWLIGAIFDEQTWPYVERGLIAGWSPEGTATRRTTKRTVAKSQQEMTNEVLARARTDKQFQIQILAAIAAQVDARSTQ